jgi:hypothetical protein
MSIAAAPTPTREGGRAWKEERRIATRPKIATKPRAITLSAISAYLLYPRGKLTFETSPPRQGVCGKLLRKFG